MLVNVVQNGWASAIKSVLSSGGWVAWVLTGISALLWFCLIQRWFLLSARAVDEFRARALPIVEHGVECVGRLDTLAHEARLRLSSLRGILRALVAAAPLLGLLGTVGGMIETFESLSSSVSAEATVAGVISTALVTTQLGLTIGIIGLIAARMLERREGKLGEDIEAERAHFAASVHADAGGTS